MSHHQSDDGRRGLPRVCAVGYLNTVPLVWGMLHGPQQGLFDLSFTTPSECARRLESAGADIGLVPAVEIPRLGCEAVPGCGIVARGEIRSILLVAKSPLGAVRTLAADSGSRTSVALARILLAERYGAEPRVVSMAPDLDAMLEVADAALLIGDAALRVEPAALPYEVCDLGAEWAAVTGKPMVFALWAGRPGVAAAGYEEAFHASCRYGIARIEEFLPAEAARRGLAEDLARAYLTRQVSYEIGRNEWEGLELFLRLAARLDAASPAGALAR